MGRRIELGFMSFCFAALVPHPALMIPTVGRGLEDKFARTRAALTEVSESLYVARPHIVVVISSHAGFFPSAFSINAHAEFRHNFAEFGDLSHEELWHGAPEFAARIAHICRANGHEARLVSSETLDHGTAVPMHFLESALKNRALVPVGFSELPPKDHLAFGECIADAAAQSEKRIAIIASADLAHTLHSDAPLGFHPSAEKFDALIQELLTTRNTAGLAAMDSELISGAQSCGWRALLILLGALKNKNYSFRHLSYEAPYGVGHLTGIFEF